jgi:hypothetical protein
MCSHRQGQTRLLRLASMTMLGQTDRARPSSFLRCPLPRSPFRLCHLSLSGALPTAPPISVPPQLARCTVCPSTGGGLAKTTEDDIFDQLSRLCQLCIQNPAPAAAPRPSPGPAPSPSVTSPYHRVTTKEWAWVLCPHRSDSTSKHNRLETQPCVCREESYSKGMSLALTSRLITDAMQRPVSLSSDSISDASGDASAADHLHVQDAECSHSRQVS